MALFGKQKAPYSHEKATLARNLDAAEIRHLEVLRREVANLIIQQDPDLMELCYDKSWQFEREVTANPARAAAEEAALVAKIPMFQDFDIIGAHHFIPYAEARGMVSDDQLVERYFEVSRMLIFMKSRSEIEVVRQKPIHNDRDRTTLRDRMRGEKGRLLRLRIVEAMARFYAYRSGVESVKGDIEVNRFEDGEVSIVHLSTPYQNEYGLHFKKTDEFGVYGFAVLDDGKVYHEYSMSDSSFTNRSSIIR